MTFNDFLEAIAAKLTEIWPERLVYVDEIPKDADGQFFVGMISSAQEKHLDRRYRRSLQFEILYFLQAGETMAFQSWAERMYDEFETLTVWEAEGKTRLVRLTNAEARPDENARVYQFTFDADFFFVVTPEELPVMETLEQSEALK